jgi:hypothetical protein
MGESTLGRWGVECGDRTECRDTQEWRGRGRKAGTESGDGRDSDKSEWAVNVMEGGATGMRTRR